MKKIYCVFTGLFIFLNVISTYAQDNLIQGGNMESEDETYWLISNLANDPSSTTEYTFGYTDDDPSAGNGACLHFMATNVGTNGSHIMFYQPVLLQRGQTYKFDMALKAIQPMNNSWFEVYLGDTEPEEGADYGPGKIALGGFKWSGWEAGCANLDLFDGTLQIDGCMQHSQDEIMIAGEGDTVMYIGFKAGIWATDCTIEFVVDNVSLVPTGVTSNKSLVDAVRLFPNPVTSRIELSSDSEYTQARILNISGKEVFSVGNTINTIDVSSLKPGIYFLELKDKKENSIVKRFIKQ